MLKLLLIRSSLLILWLFLSQLERFMPQEGSFVATVYAPIMFPPAPVLVFTQDKHTSKCTSNLGTVRFL